MIMGTIRPSALLESGEDEEAASGAVGDADVFVPLLPALGDPKRNMRKKFKGACPGGVDESSLLWPAPRSAAAKRPLSSDCRKLLKVPSSPSPATLLASAIAC